MHDFFIYAKKLVPEVVELLQKRYNVLRTIYYNQPVGRRILANNIGLGERVVRTEISFLKESNLINISTPGMTLTEEGVEVLEKLKDFIHELKGLTEIEEYIKKKLNLKNVIIVPGDVDTDKTVLTEVGKASANFIKDLLKDNTIIALTGGSTIKEVIDNVPKIPNLKDVLVVPARGGMGRSVELQANNLAANLANKLSANYKLLHIPDNLSNSALQALLKEKEVKEVVDNVVKSQILIYGIGIAEEMGRRRGLPGEKIWELKMEGAVGEAFGYYFDGDGEIIYNNSTIVVPNKSLIDIENLIAVAAGHKKGNAIVAALRNIKNSTLITDEGAAKEMINILSKIE